MKDNKERINELALQLKNGDKSVFEELYKLTSSKAYFLAFQICGNEHEAEDIVQDSYVAMLDRIGTLEKSESFMSWFNRIVANRSKDCLKKKKPRLFDDGEEKAFAVIPDETGEFSPEENVDRDELRTAVMDAVRELSADKRACVLMRYYENMSVNDIAESMEIPVSTVKNRLWRARRDLKSVFERKGITAAYSVAPLGVVTWAVNATYEIVSQTFENSHVAAKIFSGIAVAGTAAATGAVATAGTTAAAGTGIAAKAAAATTLQKVVSGLVVAGVVTGSTIGITSVVRNRKHKDDIPTTSYAETVEDAVVPAPIEEELPVQVVEKDEENPKHDAVYVQPIVNTASKKTQYAGTIYEGINVMDFDKNYNRFYCDFCAEKTGYYLIYYKNNDENKLKVSFDDTIEGWSYYGNDDEKVVNYWWTEPEREKYYAPYPAKDSETDISTVTSHPDYMTDYPKTLLYTEKGTRFIITESEENIENAELVVEYYGEEITDVEFLNDSLNNRILDYNLMAPYATSYNNYFRMNQFDVNIKFSSGKELFMGGTEIEYYIPDGIKAGENNAVFLFPGKGIEKKMVIHDMSEYITEIEVNELDEFLEFKINENGFDLSEPEEYTVTVTYSDGTKETFNGAEWDKKLTFDDGTAVIIEFTQPKLTDRESVQFIVAAGDVEFVRETCQLTGIDPIGYTKRLIVVSAEVIDCYWQLTKPSYENLFTETESIDDFKFYLDEALDITSFNTRECMDRLFGYGLDLFITFIKIASENIIVY